jgi:hypothetical protein
VQRGIRRRSMHHINHYAAAAKVGRDVITIPAKSCGVGLTSGSTVAAGESTRDVVMMSCEICGSVVSNHFCSHFVGLSAHNLAAAREREVKGMPGITLFLSIFQAFAGPSRLSS